MPLFSIRSLSAQAALVAAMLAGGVVVGGLTPAFSAGSRLDGRVARAVIRATDGAVIGRATLSPQGQATLLTLDMDRGRPALYAVSLGPGPCARVQAQSAGARLALLGVSMDGGATVDAGASVIAATPRSGDVLALTSPEGRPAACGVFVTAAS